MREGSIVYIRQDQSVKYWQVNFFRKKHAVMFLSCQLHVKLCCQLHLYVYPNIILYFVYNLQNTGSIGLYNGIQDSDTEVTGHSSVTYRNDYS